MLIYQIPLPLDVSLKPVVLFILLPQRQQNLVLLVLFEQPCEKFVFDDTQANKELQIYYLFQKIYHYTKKFVLIQADHQNCAEIIIHCWIFADSNKIFF